MSSSKSDLISRCNRTELLQVCDRIGLRAPASAPKEQLIAVIMGEEPPPEDWENVIDSWRHGIMGFLLDHWAVVRSQLDCPAKSGDPRACFECVDVQVISCVVQNRENEHLIQLYRKDKS